MMISDERRLRSEIETVRGMLAEVPEEFAIDRMSLESRIAELDRELSQLPNKPSVAKARLTFRGRPVIGSTGIFADFASKATAAFSELVTVLAAAQSKPVAWTGPIPNRDETQLLVTGTATGSFGFELQEHVVQTRVAEIESPIANALSQSRDLLESVVGDDDELTESIAGLDERAVANLRRFLEVMASNDAVCCLTYRDRDFAFRDVSQVRQSLDRLGRDNFHEETQSYFGVFLGVLPTRRTFEFRISSDGNVISGKIGSEISDPDSINRSLGLPVSIALTATRLGRGRAKYVLKELPVWDDAVAEIKQVDRQADR